VTRDDSIISAEKELATVESMIELFCRKNHEATSELCEKCSDLLEHARSRVAKCPQLPDKPTCRMCEIHCFKKEYAEYMREVMRFSGPRMMLHHPVRAVKHLLRER
jgi:hypothetical protein